MNQIKGFTFFKSYFEVLSELNFDDKHEVIDAMLNYVFFDKKPKFFGTKKIIWTLIEPNLTKSKVNSHTNSGAPLGNKNACKNSGLDPYNRNLIEKQSKNNRKTTDDYKTIVDSTSLSLSYSLSLSSPYLASSIKANKELNNLFIEYLKIREDKNYTLNDTIVKRLIDKLEAAESDEVRKEMLEQAIVGGWKDLYLIENKKQNKSSKDLGGGAFKI